VLLDEDAEALEDRRSEWAASLMPRGAAEQRIVDDAVEYTWLRDRARRAQEARLATNIVNAGVDEAIREGDEVLRLGQKLFWDNRGPLANYPHYDMEKDGNPECVPVVSESDLAEDPEDPQRLVLHLQATAGGCQWMLDRWSELRSILEEGLHWQSVDKLKAVRLLGRQPMEAVDDRNVLILFLACQVIESRTGIEIPEIWNELREFERKPYAQRLVGRGIHKLRPTDAAAARQVLFDIIDRATAQIAVKAEAHRVRAEINDSLATDRLLFDDSPEGERLRRFDLACGRGMARSLESLVKLRRASELGDCTSSVVDGPLSVAGDTFETNVTPNETNEPTDVCENVTNEPTLAAAVGLESPTCMKSTEQNSKNESADARENTTNEPAVAYLRERKVLKRSRIRIKIKSRITNKHHRPAADCENVTNEPTDARENTTNEPTVAYHRERKVLKRSRIRIRIKIKSRIKNKDLRPTVACEIVTNEPIYERAGVKRGGADFLLRASRTSPSPSASVDLAHLRPVRGRIGRATRNISSEPEAEGEFSPSMPAVYEALADVT
jgi:hypothetical protein